MPLYEFRCLKCNHIFENKQKIVDPNPSCPRLQGIGVKGSTWESFFRDAQIAFASEGLVMHPTTREKVGPDYLHTVEVEQDGYSVSKTLQEWLSEMTVCGGKTEKLISRTFFQLLGGGWASDGYSK